METNDQKGTSHQCFYGDTINKAKRFKCDISKLVSVYIQKVSP